MCLHCPYLQGSRLLYSYPEKKLRTDSRSQETVCILLTTWDQDPVVVALSKCASWLSVEPTQTAEGGRSHSGISQLVAAPEL